MDIVNFWQEQVNLWNERKYCGRCWTFGAPLTDEGANAQQNEQSQACCTNVILTGLTETNSPSYSSVTGLMTGDQETHRMTLHVLERDQLGRNTYNETLGHPIDESRWKQILKPLRDCLSAGHLLDFCAILGYNVEILTWSVRYRINWLDDNYSGISLDIALRVNK